MADAYTQPHWSRSALLTIDVQVDTLPGGALEIAGADDALPAIVDATAITRSAGRPIFHLVRLYRADGANVDVCRRARVESGWRALTPGAPGSELAPHLPPKGFPCLDPVKLLSGREQRLGPSESAIYKPRWGAFFGTPLEARLRELGVDTLVFTGVNYPNCPRASIYEASERDFRIAILSDGVSGFEDRDRREAESIGALISTAEGYRAALTASGARAASGC